jgi:DNA-directed RNA polymerase specialized sigma24 family protein
MADWNSADEQPLTAELRRAIEDATDHLPQSHREAFLFKDVAGLSYEQIADAAANQSRQSKSSSTRRD